MFAASEAQHAQGSGVAGEARTPIPSLPLRWLQPYPGYSPTQGPSETQTERKPTMSRPAYREDLILTSLLVPLLPRRHATDAVDRAPRGWCGPGDPRAGPSSPKGGDPLASPSLCAHLV